jgi:hypothetical protein
MQITHAQSKALGASFDDDYDSNVTFGCHVHRPVLIENHARRLGSGLLSWYGIVLREIVVVSFVFWREVIVSFWREVGVSFVFWREVIVSFWREVVVSFWRGLIVSFVFWGGLLRRFDFDYFVCSRCARWGCWWGVRPMLVYVCMCVCMYVRGGGAGGVLVPCWCMYVCVYVYMYVCMYVRGGGAGSMLVYVCTYVCMYICVDV